MSEEPSKKARSRLDHSANLLTVKSVRRPAEQRPTHDTIEAIADWLKGAGRASIRHSRTCSTSSVWRLVAAGMPLMRGSMHGGTLHPQFLGATYLWWRDMSETLKVMIAHEVVGIIPYAENAVRRVREGGETMRRRLEGQRRGIGICGAERFEGARGNRIFRPAGRAASSGSASTWRPMSPIAPAASPSESSADLLDSGRMLSVIADMNSQRQIAENMPRKPTWARRPGPSVLAGADPARQRRDDLRRCCGPRTCGASPSFPIGWRASGSSPS